MKFLIKSICLLYLLQLPVYAAVAVHPKAGSTSASFLRLGIGGRPVAMSAYTAISDDVQAVHWNPAGLSQLKENELSIMHNESFQGIKHNFLGYAHKLKGGYLGLSFITLTVPTDLERRSGLNENDVFDPITEVEGYFSASDIAGILSYSRKVSPSLYLGGNLKYIRQTIDIDNADTFALDLGALYSVDKIKNLKLALTLENMGGGIKFIRKEFPLPFSITFGAGYKTVNDKLILAIDFKQFVDDYLTTSIGTEYSLTDMFVVRGGYKYRLNGNPLGDISGLSTGLGVNFNNVSFDYAFKPYGVMGDTHRLSFRVRFQEIRQLYLFRSKPTGKKISKEEISLPVQKIPDIDKYTYTLAETDAKFIPIDNRTFRANVTASAKQGSIRKVNFVMPVPAQSEIKVYFGETDLPELSPKVSKKKLIYRHFNIKPELRIKKMFYEIRIPGKWIDENNVNSEKIIFMFKEERNKYLEIEGNKTISAGDFYYYSVEGPALPFTVVGIKKAR
ncbi:MAG: hypothetical protein COY53_02910 [Elusimicrobia bacterium CG_4_10_14_0_8_um_filter_37_32]|nr:MAG: hypothetical protein COS17_00385 [Elusimicrobia bacterium CG02_land_8_20_14_3_00_37_13]PIZ13816.1 MAG: hypothetical protein COY53_02910 [Elusimicrobia bacterium CG_4_10_14_0_8_um_filter_37_32]